MFPIEGTACCVGVAGMPGDAVPAPAGVNGGSLNGPVVGGGAIVPVLRVVRDGEAPRGMVAGAGARIADPRADVDPLDE